MKTLLLMVVLAQDGSRSFDNLVRALGNDLIEIRERAHFRLLTLGAAGIPALKRGLESPDSEVRLRAGLVLEMVERADRELAHDADQKESLLLLRRTPTAAAAERKPGSAGTGSARFDLEAARFEGGWIVSTRATDYLARRTDEGPGRGRLCFDIQWIAGPDGKELAVERCGRCSPGKVFVKETGGPLKVRIAGNHAWFSPYHLEFQNPVEGRRKRVGDFTIEVAWPHLRVTSEVEFPEAWLSSMVPPFQCTLKEGIQLSARDILGFG